jgi:hypothetical protein
MYYYFELVTKPGERVYNKKFDFTIGHFEHCNELKFLAHTNSSGLWGCNHFHSKWDKLLYQSVPYKIVDQYWLNTSKYEPGYDDACDFFIEHIIPLLNDEYCESR